MAVSARSVCSCLLQHGWSRLHNLGYWSYQGGLQTIGNFEKKTIKILGLDNFNSASFLRRLQNSAIGLELAIVITTRTHIFLSVSDKSFLRKNIANDKMELVKNMLDGCEYEDSDFLNIEDMRALIHVIGTPVVVNGRVDELVSKLLDLGIKSCIFVNLEPIQSPSMDCPFKTSFSVAIAGSNLEIRRHLATTISLIRALFDYNSIYVVLDRKPKRNIKKLLMGNQIYSSLLDMKHASAYFQLPMTYGIEQIKKMRFPVPNYPFRGIEIGKPAEFHIGEIDKVRLELENLYSHMAVWGASGTGKTTFLKNLLLKLHGTEVKYIIMDWHNEYRNIATDQYGRIRDDTVILNPFLGSLSVNPLEIFESDSPREILIWERIENFISLMKQMFILGEIQEARLRQSLTTLYISTNTPNISEAIILMSERKMRSLTLKLDKFTKDFYGHIFNRRKSSLSFSQLRRMNVIIELGQLPTEVRMFFACVFLILWWDSLKINDPTPNVLVLDDFYRYANLEVIKKMLSEARKFKQGLICSHQGPYQLPQGIREEVVRNTSTKVIFRQEQTWDKYIVRDALGGLTKEQLESLSYLKTGQAIVKLPSIQFPIRVDCPKPPETKYLLDIQVENSMKRFIGELESYKVPRIDEPLEKKFLKVVHEQPNASLTEITRSLEIKTRRGYEIKDRLIGGGFISEEKIKKGIGRPKTVYKLTKEGLDYLDQDNTAAPQHGKAEHLNAIKNIASKLKGWDVKVEDGCDIKAEKDGRKVAIEVETTKSNEKKQILYNVDRDAAWADKVVIVCPNKQEKLKIVDLLQTKAQDVSVITYRQIDKINEILEL